MVINLQDILMINQFLLTNKEAYNNKIKYKLIKKAKKLFQKLIKIIFKK